jgi:hypothetical protein
VTVVRAGRWLPVLLGLLSCGRERPAESGEADAGPAAAAPAESLALRTPAGIEVWFTAARPAVDSAGSACVERVMEIRQEGRRMAIPLLYTGQVPRLVDDSTIEAPIWLHCRPGNVYRVSLRTGQPVRIK